MWNALPHTSSDFLEKAKLDSSTSTPRKCLRFAQTNNVRYYKY